MDKTPKVGDPCFCYEGPAQILDRIVAILPLACESTGYESEAAKTGRGGLYDVRGLYWTGVAWAWTKEMRGEK